MGSSQSHPIVAEVATPLPSAILEKAAELISPPSRWHQGDEAADENAQAVSAADDDAVCWCAIGAIYRSAFDLGATPLTDDAADFLGEAIPTVDIAGWNDATNRTQAEVVSKLREAATLAREQGQ